MPKKLAFEFVKNYIEEQNYQLLSTEYINNYTKLKIRCDKGHEYEVAFNNFKNGYRCLKCSIINRAVNQKHSFQYIKQFIEKENYTLLSTEYINARTKLKIKCDKGHILNMRFDTFKQGSRCLKCWYKGNENTYEFVKKCIEEKNHQLLSTKYINNKTKLKLRCPKNHIFMMSFNHFQQGNGCPDCSNRLTTSKGEKEVLSYIQNIYTGKIIENDRTKILNPLTNHYLELDIYLPEINKAIEYNGDYWHSIPYAIKNDKIKEEECRRLGIALLIIEENKWISNKKNCYNEIQNFI